MQKEGLDNYNRQHSLSYALPDWQAKLDEIIKAKKSEVHAEYSKYMSGERGMEVFEDRV